MKIAAPRAALCGARVLAAGADMPTMIAAEQHLATRPKKRQSARVPRDQTLAAAMRPICPLIDPLLIAARRPDYRHPSVERVQKPLRESPLEVSDFRASLKADRL
jgi:hypothetical protein